MNNINAVDFVQRIQYPVVVFNSIGIPCGMRVAILDDTELPFNLLVVNGEERGGSFFWDGIGTFSDWNRNTVLTISIEDNKE